MYTEIGENFMTEQKEAKKNISLTVPAKLLADFDEICDKSYRTRGKTLLTLMEAYIEKAPQTGMFESVQDIKAVI